MTFKELEEIEERWKFGTNTRADVRLLLDCTKELIRLIEERQANDLAVMKFMLGDPSVPKPQGIIEHPTKG